MQVHEKNNGFAKIQFLHNTPQRGAYGYTSTYTRRHCPYIKTQQ